MPASSQTVSVPAPVGGWNARDSLANMPSNMAVTMINMFPTPSSVNLRNGFVNWATGLPGQVNSVFGYNGASSKLFAGCGAGIYDVSSTGAVGSALVTGQTSDRYVTTHLSTLGGTYLYAVNGSDYPQIYNGTAWQQVTSSSTPFAISGITNLQKLSFVHTAKMRIWFVEGGSTRAWYLPTTSLGGTAQQLDLGPVFRNGGTLVSIGTWSAMGGFGAQDFLVFVSSTGEIAVYQGTDPSQLTTWALVGVWQMGSPMGNRCLAKYGADLLYLSKDGLTSFNQGRFFSDVSANKSALTDSIQWAISTATSNYANNNGWQAQNFPLSNALVVNIPVSQGSQVQYVQNTVTGAWCQFQGWAANCFEIWKDQLYFGGNGVVALAWTGYSDNGANIVGECLPAFSQFGADGQVKNWTMVRPVLLTSGSPGVSVTMNVDFDQTPPIGSPITNAASGTVWGSAQWGSSYWPYSQVVVKNWQYITGMGFAGAAHIKISTNSASVQWAQLDYQFEVGGVL